MRRVLITNPRSGTHYLKALISPILGDPPVEQAFATAQELRAAISAASRTQLIYGHFRYSEFAAELDQQKQPDLRLVLLTRHPIDRLISQLAWERALGGRLPDPTRTPQELARELLLGEWDGRPWADGFIVADYATVHNFYLRELVTDWVAHRNCHVVKFEDLIAHPQTILSRCLDFLKVSAPPQAVRSVTERINFASLSGGRKPGQPDPTSHYRSGITGEWREVFSTEQIILLHSKYAVAFREAGYEL